MNTVNLRKHKRIHLVSGFTLVELLIAMAIIGVLAAIAIPAYQDYKEKARVNQAATQISVMASKIGQYWQDARSYPDSLADVGLGAELDPWGYPYRYLNLDKKVMVVRVAIKT